MSNNTLDIILNPNPISNYGVKNKIVFKSYRQDLLKSLHLGLDDENILLMGNNFDYLGGSNFKIFNSIENKNRFYLDNYSQLVEDDFDRLKYIIDEKSIKNYKIHGSFFADKSTLGFILQLSSYLDFGEPLTKNNEKIYLPLILERAKFDELSNLPISYGVTIKNKNKKFFEKSYYNFLSKQFINENTSLYKF